MNEYQEPVYTLHMFVQVAFIKIFRLDSLTTSINGPLSSVIVLTRPRNYLPIIEFGLEERRALVLSRLLML